MLVFPAGAMAEEAGLSPELSARMAKEKEDRKACKTEICKAFAAPSDGAPITCRVTKTWLGTDIQANFLRDKPDLALGACAMHCIHRSRPLRHQGGRLEVFEHPQA